MSDFLKLVGEQIRIIRKTKMMTQEDLSNRSGLSLSYISDTERGTRNLSLESLEKIITALDVPPSSIFSFKEIGDIELENKLMLIEVIRSLLINLDIDDIKYIHQVTKSFVDLVNARK